MKTISLKLSETVAKEIDTVMGKFPYNTKSEFIREAIREKLYEFRYGHSYKEAMRNLRNNFGASKVKTTPEDDRKIREKVSKELEEELRKRFNIK